MKHIALLFILLMLVSVPSAASAAPRIQLSTDKWELGNVYQWDDPALDVSIKNTGDADLVIKQVKSSCGCTVTELSEKVVKPGETAVLTITVAVAQLTGHIKKQVVVISNDPVSAQKSVEILGVMMPDKKAVVSIEPTSVDMGVVTTYETRYFNLRLTNKGNIDLHLTEIKLADGFFLDTVIPSKLAPRTAENVRVGFKREKVGLVQDELKLITGNAQTGLGVRVVGYVSDATSGTDSLVMTPTAFKLSSDGVRGLEIGVKNGGTGDILVDGVESSLDGVEPASDSTHLAPGQSGRITLKVAPGAVKPGKRGYVYIRVAVPVEMDVTAGDK